MMREPLLHDLASRAQLTWPSALEAIPKYLMILGWRSRSRIEHSRLKSSRPSVAPALSIFTATSTPFQRPLYTCMWSQDLTSPGLIHPNTCMLAVYSTPQALTTCVLAYLLAPGTPDGPQALDLPKAVMCAPAGQNYREPYGLRAVKTPSLRDWFCLPFQGCPAPAAGTLACHAS